MSGRRKPTVRVTLEVPQTPNFIRTIHGQTVAIEEIPDADLRGIAKNWTALLLRKARNRRRAAEAESREER